MILQLTIISNLSLASDWDRYKESSLDDIISVTNEYYRTHGKGGG